MKQIKLSKITSVLLSAALAVPVFSGMAVASDISYFSKEAAGTTGADFLNLPVGARAVGMAGAYSSVAEDASAIYWNPAGLVQIPKLSAMFMRSEYVDDISYQYAAYAQRLSYDSVIGISFMMTDIGSIEGMDKSRNSIGSFNPQDQVFTLSYSKAILEFSNKDLDVSMGLNAKYIKSEIRDSATAFAGDMGIMTFNFGAIPYRIGVVVSNIGKGLKYDQASDPLPVTARFGGSINPFDNLLIAADVVVPKGNKMNIQTGVEAYINPNELTRLTARAGVDMQQMQDGFSGISLGIGATLQFFTLDYAFVPMGELGNTHRISLSFDFPFRSPIFQRRDRSVFTDMKGLSFK